MARLMPAEARSERLALLTSLTLFACIEPVDKGRGDDGGGGQAGNGGSSGNGGSGGSGRDAGARDGRRRDGGAVDAGAGARIVTATMVRFPIQVISQP